MPPTLAWQIFTGPGRRTSPRSPHRRTPMTWSVCRVGHRWLAGRARQRVLQTPGSQGHVWMDRIRLSHEPRPLYQPQAWILKALPAP
ncbi:hypothetical protein SCANM63S_00839 [Streptomyces canarius]